MDEVGALRPAHPAAPGAAHEAAGAAAGGALLVDVLSAASPVLRERFTLTGDYAKENGDQIAQACAAGQKYGIPVHARMLALFVYEASAGIRETYRKAGRLQVSTKGKVSSTWLCPSHPENRNLVINCCMEMASKYPVAGIQLDYIRYDGREWCYCSTCKAKFQKDAGVTVDSWPSDCYSGKYRGRFADWRREQINSIMRELRARLKAYDPAIQFSADVFVNWEGHRVEFGQDWKVWVDEGLCDFVCPMDYFGKDEDFIKWVTRQREWIRDDVPMCVGLGPRVEQTALTPQHMLEQIEMSRDLGGDGIVLFDYDEIMARDHLPVCGGGPSSAPSNFTVDAPFLRCKSSPLAGGAKLEYALDTYRRFDGANPQGGAVSIQAASLLLYTADAWPVYDMGALVADQTFAWEVTLAPGRYRLCAMGELTRNGASEQFVRWGPVFEVGEGN